MDYSALSDFEVNCAVLSINEPDINHMSLSADGSCFFDCGPTGQGWHQIDIPDYCNSPADAWPIIVESGIGIVPSRKDPYAWDLSGGMLSGIRYSDENPLRAAMVVFLMMHENNGGNGV